MTKVKFTRIARGYYPFPVWEFNLPAGFTCPYAAACLTWAHRETGKQTSGPLQEHKCYAAVVERYPAVRDVRWRNFDVLRRASGEEMAAALVAALPSRATHVRIHGGGDFFNQAYFDAWLTVVASNPCRTFWAFTKSLNFWVRRLDQIPINFTLTASYGGTQDHLIEQHGLKHCRVFKTLTEVEASGLPLDTDDTAAMSGPGNFALLDNFSPDGRAAKRKG